MFQVYCIRLLQGHQRGFLFGMFILYVIVRDAQIMMFLDLALKITNNYKTGSILY